MSFRDYPLRVAHDSTAATAVSQPTTITTMQESTMFSTTRIPSAVIAQPTFLSTIAVSAHPRIDGPGHGDPGQDPEETPTPTTRA